MVPQAKELPARERLRTDPSLAPSEGDAMANTLIYDSQSPELEGKTFLFKLPSLWCFVTEAQDTNTA